MLLFVRRLLHFLWHLLLGLGVAVVLFVGWRIWVLVTATPPSHADIVQQVVQAKTLPALTAQHLQLVRALRVWWVPVESGAPGVDPAQPLLGTAPAVQTAQQLLATDDAALATQRLAEVARWVVPFVAQAQLAPGRYAVPAEMQVQLPGVHQGQFTLRAQHLTLLRAQHLTLLRAAMWREVDGDSLADLLAQSTEAQPLWPMPYIDGKRPYGDRSYYTIDMAELLGRPFVANVSGTLVIPRARHKALTQLHEETLTALQVLFLYGKMPLADPLPPA